MIWPYNHWGIKVKYYVSWLLSRQTISVAVGMVGFVLEDVAKVSALESIVFHADCAVEGEMIIIAELYPFISFIHLGAASCKVITLEMSQVNFLQGNNIWQSCFVDFILLILEQTAVDMSFSSTGQQIFFKSFPSWKTSGVYDQISSNWTQIYSHSDCIM